MRKVWAHPPHTCARYGPPLIDCYDQIQLADWHDTWPDPAEAADAKKNAYKM
jgi:hypothetical protein